jgi:hypothetical protein
MSVCFLHSYMSLSLSLSPTYSYSLSEFCLPVLFSLSLFLSFSLPYCVLIFSPFLLFLYLSHTQ